MGLVSAIDIIVLLALSMDIDGADARDCFKDGWRGVRRCFVSGGKENLPERILNLEKLAHSRYSEAYLVIDRHLRKKILLADLDRNLDEISRQRARESGKDRDWSRLRPKSGLSEQLRGSKLTRLDMIVSMDKLLTLRHRDSTQMCKVDGVKNLTDNNIIALNPIEQHAKSKPYLLTRIGSMIVETALNAAPVCLNLFKHELSRLLNQRFLPDPEWVVLQEYCDGVLAFHLNRNGRPFEGAFEVGRARDTVEVLKRLDNRLDDQEILIGLKTGDKQEQQSPKEKRQARTRSTINRKGAARSNMEYFGEYVMEPCEKYKYNVGYLFRGIELYSPLARSLPDQLLNSTVCAEDVTKLWTMYLICERIGSLRNDIENKLDRRLLIQIDDERDKLKVFYQLVPRLIKPQAV